MDKRRTFPAVTQQFALACGIYTLSNIMSLANGTQGGFFPLILLPYAPTVYALNRLYLRRSRTVRALVILNAAFFLTLVGSVLAVEGLGDWAAAVFKVLFCLWVTARGCQICIEPLNLRAMITAVDMSILALLVSVGALAGMGLPAAGNIPAIAGCAASILGLIAWRIDRPMRAREWGMILLAFAGLCTAAWLLVAVAAAPAGQGLVTLWNFLTATVQKIARILWSALAFLASLFPAPEYGEMPLMEGAAPAVQGDVELQSDPVLVVIMIVLAAAAAAAIVIFALVRLGKLRIGGGKEGAEVPAGRRHGRISLWQAMKRMWKALREGVKFQILLWRGRNTAEGAFYLLVRRLRMSPWHKRMDETPREFLNRLQMAVAEDEELCGALEGMIPAVDTAFYSSGGGGRIYSPARLIRKRFGAAARRHLIYQTARRLRTAVKRTPKEV